MPSGATRNIIGELLRHIGGRKEVNEYLRHYSTVDSQKFAVIKIGGGIVRDQLATVATSLTFLHRVGLYPIVVHGAGPQIDEALKDANIKTDRIDGLRVTTTESLEVIRRVCQSVNLQLVEALGEHGCAARPIPSGVFHAEAIDESRYGLVGNVSQVDTASIASSIRSGQLPIVTNLGESAGGQILNVNADAAARALARIFEPHKIIFLTPTGGLLDGDEQIISAINLTEDYDRLMQQPWLTGGMRLKIEQIHELLGELPVTSSVSITSPRHLERELFTHRGAGTLLRRGEGVLRHESFDEVDHERLRALLESCFERELNDSYFSDKQCYRVYLTESFRATAILTQEGGIPYLDKFAVTRKAQGEGLGSSVWERMRQDNQKLFWRAQTNNPINPWYFEQADGTHRTDKWTVFWYGMDGFDEVQRCVEAALAQPATLRDHGVKEDG